MKKLIGSTILVLAFSLAAFSQATNERKSGNIVKPGYICPNGDYRADTPGKCPADNMDLKDAATFHIKGNPAKEVIIKSKDAGFICPKGDYVAKAPGKCPKDNEELRDGNTFRIEGNKTKLQNVRNRDTEVKDPGYICPKGDYVAKTPGKCPKHNDDLLDGKDFRVEGNASQKSE